MSVVPQIIQDVGFDFDWDNKKVWALDIPVTSMPMSDLAWHFDIPFWDSEGADEYNLKPSEVIAHPEKEPTHFKKIMEADLSYLIDIMENKRRWLILDGLHRLVRLNMLGTQEIKVRIVPREMISQILCDKH